MELWFCVASSDLLTGYYWKLKLLHYEGVLRKDLFKCAISSLQGFSLMVRLHIELQLY